MNPRPGNRATWWVRLALGAGALATVAWLVEPEEIFAAIAGAQYAALAVAALLLAPNLWFQFLKWRYLLRAGGYKLADRAVWQSLLYGFAFGIVTPARVGEFGGRMMADRSLQSAEAAGLVGVDKFAAMIVTVVFGLLAIAVWGFHFDWFGVWPAIGIGIVSISAPVVAWRIIRAADMRIERFRDGNPFLRNICRLSNAARRLSAKEFSTMLLLSTGFYLTFVLQFTVLIFAFEDAGIVYSVLGIACVMIAKTVVPPVTLGELGIREGFAVFFLTMTGLSPATAFGASMLLFVINILLPSAAGGLLLLRSTFQPRFQE